MGRFEKQKWGKQKAEITDSKQISQRLEGRRQNKETRTFQSSEREAGQRTDLRKLPQPVKGLKRPIQKTSRRLLVVGGDEVARGDEVSELRSRGQ